MKVLSSLFLSLISCITKSMPYRSFLFTSWMGKSKSGGIGQGFSLPKTILAILLSSGIALAEDGFVIKPDKTSVNRAKPLSFSGITTPAYARLAMTESRDVSFYNKKGLSYRQAGVELQESSKKPELYNSFILKAKKNVVNYLKTKDYEIKPLVFWKPKDPELLKKFGDYYVIKLPKKISKEIDIAKGKTQGPIMPIEKLEAKVDSIYYEIKNLKGVEFIEPNYKLKPEPQKPGMSLIYPFDSEGYVPNDPRFDKQWNLQKIEWDKAALKLKKTNRKVKLAIIDTGCDPNHPDLQENRLQGWNFIDNNENTDDTGKWAGHGTHVTGIACATTDNNEGISGIGFNLVNFMPLKVNFSAGEVAQATIWATDHDADAINYSGGGPGNFPPLEDAVNYAYNKGVFFCAGSGNDGKNIDEDPIYPACYNEYVVAVGSTMPDDSREEYSNYSLKKKGFIYAPGVHILTTELGGGYAYHSGTSDASPHVAAVGALVKAVHPEFSVQEIRDRVLKSADTLDLDVGKALRVNLRKAIIDYDLNISSLGFDEETLKPSASVENWGFYDFNGNLVAQFLQNGNIVYSDTQNISLKRDSQDEIKFKRANIKSGTYTLKILNITEDDISENNEKEREINVTGIAERPEKKSKIEKIVVKQTIFSEEAEIYLPSGLRAKLYDITGRVVEKFDKEGINKISQGLPAGVYFLKADEKKIEGGKIIKLIKSN